MRGRTVHDLLQKTQSFGEKNSRSERGGQTRSNERGGHPFATLWP